MWGKGTIVALVPVSYYNPNCTLSNAQRQGNLLA